MSVEEAEKILSDLGLTRLDLQVYMYLVKNGPTKGKDLSKGLKVQKQRLYPSLKKLRTKSIVNATLEHPAKFSAVSVSDLFEVFIKSKMAEAQSIEDSKKKFLENSLAAKNIETSKDYSKFNVIEGRGPIYAKILQLIGKAKNHLSIISSVAGLIRANESGLFEEEIKKSSKIIRGITQVSTENLAIAKKFIEELLNEQLKFEIKVPELNSNLPQMIIRDEEEILIFINPTADNTSIEQNNTCLWTNCKSLVQAFSGVFEEYWRNSTDIIAKILEIENRSIALITHNIYDAEATRKKYDLAVNSARKEIFMIASPKELIGISENKLLTDLWSQGSVSAKIMTPITSKSFSAMETMSKQIEVRHIPAGYLGTTIIDKKHLFQFKKTPTGNEASETEPTSENIFYTDDIKYIEKTQNMLDDLWKNVQKPSKPVIGILNKSSTDSGNLLEENRNIQANKRMYNVSVSLGEKEATQPTSQDLLDNIKNQNKPSIKTTEKVPITYSTNAQAIIHPVANLKLPETLFHIYHMEKHSTFGSGDMISVNLWLETPKGYAFVTAAIITNNPKSVKLWRKCCAGTPAQNNVQVVKEDELDVRVYGKTMFAGWTTAIPLPEPFVLPPSCLIIEGYGEAKYTAYDIFIPSGYVLRNSGNISEAYVTFLHPQTKYSGPGTDGAISKDVVTEWHPPKNGNKHQKCRRT